MELVQSGKEYAFEVTFTGPGLSVAMSVYDVTTGTPTLVQGPSTMQNIVNGTYIGKFTPTVLRNYLVFKAVYTDGTYATLNTDYLAGSETLRAEDLIGDIGTLQSTCDAIKAKTDNLPVDPASNTVVNSNAVSILSAVNAIPYPDNTGIAAIKAKTDNLPASPASSSLKKGQVLGGFQFIMLDSINQLPAPDLDVTAERSIDGAAFGPCTNPVTEIGEGWYTIDLSSSDLNGNSIGLKFTADLALEQAVTIVTEE